MAKMSSVKIKWDQEPGIREKIFFGAMVVALLYLFINFFWMPLSATVRSIREEAKGVDAQAGGIQKLLDLTREQMNKIAVGPQKGAVIDERTKRILERRVPGVNEEINSTIDLLANRNFSKRAKVRRVDTGPRVETPNYTMVPLMIEIEGPYTGVQWYLEAVERLDRPIVVRKFSMQPDKAIAGSLVTAIDAELYIAKR